MIRHTISRQQQNVIKGFRSLSSTAGNQREIVLPRLSSSNAQSPAKLHFTFFYQQQQLQSPQNENLYDQVIVPTETGRVSIQPGYPATHVVLKPGVVSLVNGNHTTKYFVSSGFAFIHGHSRVDIATDHEAIPLDHFDIAEIQKGLAEFTLKLSSASTDMEKAEALIGLEVNNALNAALQEPVEEEAAASSPQL